MMLYDIAAFPPVDFRVQAAFFFRKGWKVIILKFNSLESHLYLFSYLQKNSFSRSCQIVAISCKRSLCVGVLSVRWLHWSASQVTRTSENMIVTLQQVGCTWKPPACIRNDKSCHLWRYDVYNCTTYIMKSTSSNSTTDFRKKKGVKFWKSNQDSHLKLWAKPSQKNPCPLHPQRFGFRRGLHILSQHVEAWGAGAFAGQTPNKWRKKTARWMFPKIVVPPKWMVYNGKTLLEWMIWGYHYFWKHPDSYQ